MVDHRRVRQSRRIVNFLLPTLLVIYHIRYVRHGGDDIHIELTVQTLLHNLHVEQAQESATEAEAQGHRTLRREGQGSIVELQLFERSTQVLVIAWVDRINTCEDHWLHLLETSDGFLTRTSDMRDGITHLHLGGILDTRDDVAYLTGTQLIARNHIHLEHTYLVGIILHARIEELHLVTLTDHTILYLEVSDDATEGVEHGVENQSLQRSLVIALGMRNTIDHCLQDILDTLARLTRRTKDVLMLATDEIDNLVLHLVRHGGRHIYLVDDRDNLQVMLDGHI